MVLECPQCDMLEPDGAELCPRDGSSLEPLFEGTAILAGKYQLLRRMGRGGMGGIYQAFHLGLRKMFALKLILPQKATEQSFFARFRVEAEALGRLEHPNIVAVTDFGIEQRGDGLPYLVMEYLTGQDLATHCEEHGPLSPDEALPILEAIASGIDYAHRQGILHRDLKPRNIFLARNEDGKITVKILDFGLARIMVSQGEFPCPASFGMVEAPSGVLRTANPDDETMTIGAALQDRLSSAGAPINATPSRAVSSPPASTAPARAGSTDNTLVLPEGLDTPDDSASRAASPWDQTQVIAGAANASTAEPPGMARRLSEMGLSVGSTERLTQMGAVVGTIRYTPPEVLQNQDATPASDIYSFGVLAYELLTGRPPFEGSVMEIAGQHLLESPPRPSEVGHHLAEELDETILRPLAKAPEERPRTAKVAVEEIALAMVGLRRREWRRHQIPRRLAMAAAIALLAVAASGWGLGNELFHRLENITLDSRFLQTPLREPAPGFLLVSIDDEALQSQDDPLSVRAEEICSTLAQILEAGARHVAIDFFFPKSWSRSAAFRRLILKYSDSLTLASLSGGNNKVVGPDSLSRLLAVALGPEKLRGLFAFVNLDHDSDGLIRRARLGYEILDGTIHPTWPAHAAKSVQGEDALKTPSTQRFLIDYSVDPKKLPRIPWNSVSKLLQANPERFRDKLVLFGGDFTGSGDIFTVPHHQTRPWQLPGLTLQALAVSTILKGFPVHHAKLFPVLLGLGFYLAALTAVILCLRRLWAALVLGAAGMSYIFIAFAVFHKSLLLLPIVMPVTVATAAAGAAWLLRRRLSPFPAQGDA